MKIFILDNENYDVAECLGNQMKSQLRDFNPDVQVKTDGESVSREETPSGFDVFLIHDTQIRRKSFFADIRRLNPSSYIAIRRTFIQDSEYDLFANEINKATYTLGLAGRIAEHFRQAKAK